MADLVTELAAANEGGTCSPPRRPHAAVRTVFSWSLRHLPAAATAPSGWWACTPTRLRPYAVAALIDVSLAHTTRSCAGSPSPPPPHHVRGRYALHDLLREYANGSPASTRPEDRQAAPGRLFDYSWAPPPPRWTSLPAKAIAGPGSSPDHASPTLADPDAARVLAGPERACLVAMAAQRASRWPATRSRSRRRCTAIWTADITARRDIHGHALDAADGGDRAGEAQALLSLGTVHWQLAGTAGRRSSPAQPGAVPPAGDDIGQARALGTLGWWRLGRATTAQRPSCTRRRSPCSARTAATGPARLTCEQPRPGRVVVGPHGWPLPPRTGAGLFPRGRGPAGNAMAPPISGWPRTAAPVRAALDTCSWHSPCTPARRPRR